MKKILHIGSIQVQTEKRTINAPVFIKVETRYNERKTLTLSISGVIGPKSNGNAWGGCGQIDMEFKHRESKDYDERYSDHLISPADINFTPEWNTSQWYDLLDVWKKYHLNDMHAECEHQRALGWTYKTHKGQRCPTCGYKIGTEWKSENIPDAVLSFLNALPESKVTPAWI